MIIYKDMHVFNLYLRMLSLLVKQLVYRNWYHWKSISMGKHILCLYLCIFSLYYK